MGATIYQVQDIERDLEISQAKLAAGEKKHYKRVKFLKQLLFQVRGGQAKIRPDRANGRGIQGRRDQGGGAGPERDPEKSAETAGEGI